jgi:hypothetical protein
MPSGVAVAMKFAITLMLGALAGVTLANPSFSANNKKKPSGIYCEQGSQNVMVPMSAVNAKHRKRLYVGQKAKINVSGIGPLQCRVY